MYGIYALHKDKVILVTNFEDSRLRKSYPGQIEQINFVKEKESVLLVMPRILRTYPGYVMKELFKAPKYVMTPEHKEALLKSKLGKPRSEEVRRKISLSKKGKSNFEGKKHTYETKRVMAARKIGNQHNKNYIWAYNPDLDKEIMVKDRTSIPRGFSQGRDVESVEPGLYEMRSYKNYV